VLGGLCGGDGGGGGGALILAGACDVVGPSASEVHIAAGLASPPSLFLTLCHLSPQ
jgi:hypothetical protein